MKNTITTAGALTLAVFLAACGGGKQKQAENNTESISEISADAKERTYAVNPASSTVAWKGEVANVYGHNGVIDLAEGTLMAKGNTLTGGEVTIDMTTIQPLDSASYSEEEGKRAIDLVSHLSTEDFFLVEEYPTASFKIKKHEGNNLIGDLTVRGNTHEETAIIESLALTNEGLNGNAKLVFDRQKYDVNWEHFIKDYVLSDNITLNIELTATAL